MEKSEFGDFEEIKDEKDPKSEEKQEEEQLASSFRIRSPRKGQFLGVVLQRLGGKRMSVKTTDNKIRNCRVPGKFSRKFWLRPGNAVIIEPWPDDDDKGDVVYQYSKNDCYQLKKKGLLAGLDREF